MEQVIIRARVAIRRTVRPSLTPLPSTWSAKCAKNWPITQQRETRSQRRRSACWRNECDFPPETNKDQADRRECGEERRNGATKRSAG